MGAVADVERRAVKWTNQLMTAQQALTQWRVGVTAIVLQREQLPVDAANDDPIFVYRKTAKVTVGETRKVPQLMAGIRSCAHSRVAPIAR